MRSRFGSAVMSCFLLATALGLVAGTTAGAAPATEDIRVKIEGFTNTKGQVLVALYNSEKTWLKQEKATRAIRQAVTGSSVEIVFKGLPLGNYAIAIVHDENKNGKLDFGFFPPGPKEWAGLSNNPTPSFGPPSYDEAVFTLAPGGARLQIKLQK